MENSKTILLTAVVALAVGLVGGYYYGNTRGIEAGEKKGIEIGATQGRTQLLAEQKKAEEEKLAEIQKAANPFSEEALDKVNPFKSGYVNPFAQ